MKFNQLGFHQSSITGNILHILGDTHHQIVIYSGAIAQLPQKIFILVTPLQTVALLNKSTQQLDGLYRYLLVT